MWATSAGCSDSDVHADRKSNMQYMKALFVSEEPHQDAPKKMSGLLQDFKSQSERRSHGPRILGLTGPDVTKVRQSGASFDTHKALALPPSVCLKLLGSGRPLSHVQHGFAGTGDGE